MARRVMHENAFAAFEEMRAELRQAPVFCPKPRRLSQLAGAGAGAVDRHRLRPDSPSGSDLLDLFLSKGGEHNQVASSPPFFNGSPPTRSANPLIHDARFREDKPVFQTGPVHQTGSPLSPTRKGCGPTKFGFKPAPVRIEGFDCLDRRDRPSRSITAVA